MNGAVGYLNGVEGFAAMEFSRGDTGDHVSNRISTEGVGEDSGQFRVAVGDVS